MKTPLDTLNRFLSKIDIRGADECWPWVAGGSGSGYGQFYLDGHHLKAHRVAHEIWVGPIPEGLEVDHTCHNGTGCPGGFTCPHRRCCNPRHLEAVTHQVNSARGNSWGGHHAAKTHCPHGHPYAGANLRVRKKTGRACRECDRLQHRRRYQRRAA